MQEKGRKPKDEEHTSKEEREVKIRVSPKYSSKIANYLAYQTQLVGEYDQKDIYFDTPEAIITNLNRGLRARFEGPQPTMFEFKSLFFNQYANRENPWYIEEIVMPLPFTSETIKILNAIFRRLQLPVPPIADANTLVYFELAEVLHSRAINPAIIVDKHRVQYENPFGTFTLDSLAPQGQFFEVEVNPQYNALSVLKYEVGIPVYEIVREGYNDMIARDLPGFLTSEEKQARFRKDPRWNIQQAERLFVENLLVSANL